MGGVRLRPVGGGRQTRIRLNDDAGRQGMQLAHHNSHGGVYLDASLMVKRGSYCANMLPPWVIISLVGVPSEAEPCAVDCLRATCGMNIAAVVHSPRGHACPE